MIWMWTDDDAVDIVVKRSSAEEDIAPLDYRDERGREITARLGQRCLRQRARTAVSGRSGNPFRRRTLEPLPFTAVLDEVRCLCSSQDRRAPTMLGTDLGDRLRDARAMFVRDRGNKKGHLAGLL
jgi:hypothetical protein